MKLSTATDRGTRFYQEDEILAENTPEGHLLAIADGHGGEQVSRLVCSVLPDFWRKAGGGSVANRFSSLFENLHDLTKNFDSGSTLSVVFVPAQGKTAHVAVLGDSPVVIKDADGVVSFSPDHNVRSNQAEARAGVARGGVIQNGYLMTDYSDLAEGLQMSRALGDKGMGNILSRVPDVYEVKLGPDSWILVASDGLLDPTHIKKESKHYKAIFAALENPDTTAQDLVAMAVKAKTNDNVSVILFRG